MQVPCSAGTKLLDLGNPLSIDGLLKILLILSLAIVRSHVRVSGAVKYTD